MSKFEKRQHNLQKAQARFEKVSKRSKQFKIRYERSRNSKGKFTTNANVVREEKTYSGNNRGLLHKAVNQKNRIVGDTPSLTKTINSFEPKTFKGKVFKKSAQAVNKSVHIAGGAAVNTALAAETASIKAAETAKREIENNLRQKYTREAIDDYHRGIFAEMRIGKDAIQGARQHFKEKKRNKLEKAKFKLKKAEYKIFKEDKFKPKLKKNKFALKSAKSKFKEHKRNYKEGSRSNLQKAFMKRRRQIFKQNKREINFDTKKQNIKNDFKVDELSSQRKIKNKSKTGFLAFKPAKYTASRMKTSAWQKTVNENADNDVLHAVDSAKRRVITPIAHKFSKEERLRREQEKMQKLSEREKKADKKLRQQENKLKEKPKKQKKKKRSHNKKKQKDSLSEQLKKIFKKAINFVKNICETEIRLLLFYICLPIIILLLIFTFILMIFSSISSGGGFVLGTYPAQDYDLSKSVEYYTKLAWDMNQKVIKCGTDDWKDALKDLGVNTHDYDDDPYAFVWGRSEMLNYDSAYDFDVYKLWGFLCAYYYDFSSDESDINFWDFDDDTEELLEELFADEYQFEHIYDNNSNWQELNSYNCDGQFHFTASGGYQGSECYIDLKNVPADLEDFALGNRVYYNVDNGEILNFYKGFKPTGWYFQDQRYSVQDPSGNVIEPFYEYNPDAFKTDYSDGFGKTYTQNYREGTEVKSLNFWMPRSKYTLTLADGRDFSNTFCAIAAPDDVVVSRYFNFTLDGLRLMTNFIRVDPNADLIKDNWNRPTYRSYCKTAGEGLDGYDGYGYCRFYQKYFWQNECTLYYNVRQKKTFDQAIYDKLNSMSHSEERLEYYNLLIGMEGDPMYGNHQTLTSVTSVSVHDAFILNGYGYDMQEWNKKHCAISEFHDAIDISCEVNTEIHSPLKCKIKSYDSDTHTVILRTDDVDYWYDGSGGTDRDTEVTIVNVKLKSGFSEGDYLDEGQVFAVSTGRQHCDDLHNPSENYIHIKVEIDTDGWGWDFIDPRLVFY